MKKWRFTQFLSLVLVLAMLFQMLPAQCFAATYDTSTAVEVEDSQHEVSVLGEVEDLREEDTKHFRLSDGSFVAVSYGMPVHFQNGNGEWTDIDNCLSLAAGAYRTANSSTPVAFSSTLTDGKLFSVEHNGQSVSMTLLDTEMADRMISGEPVPEETEPEETESEPIETTEATEETVPEETQPPQTEPVEETTEETEVVTDATEEVYTEKAPDAFELDTNAPSEDAFEPMSEEAEANATALFEENIEADEEGEALPEENNEFAADENEVSEETQQDLPEAQPEATEEETPGTTTAETIPAETVPEEKIPEETISEETIPEETDAEDAAGLTFNRDVIAEVVTETPAMLTLQDKYNWDVNDVIPEKLQSSLIYQDVFPGIDLQYTTYGYNIKEQIIVNEPQESYRFDFLLESDGLNAVLNENGSVSFLNANQEEVYQIPTPCMEDALGLGSFDVHFVLNETEQGTVLTVEADEEWINSEDREFPVKIDPTLVVISGNALEV